MADVTVLIPGIMGSRLQSVTGDRLWDEDALDSVLRVSAEPSRLKLIPGQSIVTPAGILAEVDIPIKGRLGLYRLMRDEMHNRAQIQNWHYDEYSYDWRKDLFEIAENFGSWLEEHGFAKDAQGRQKSEGSARLNLIGHSMGCLVAAISLLEGHVHHDNVRRFICIGAPFLGSPAAFQALYDRPGALGPPLLDRFVYKRRDVRTGRRALRETMQSFPSLYQLLPREMDAFVSLNESERASPLLSEVIPTWGKEAARRAHECLDELGTFVNEHLYTKCRVIYSIAKPRSPRIIGLPKDTVASFNASLVSLDDESLTYRFIRPKRRMPGDGTVLEESSTLGNLMPDITLLVSGAEHGRMCDNSNIVKSVIEHLV